MAKENDVIKAAKKFSAKDEAALELLLGKQAKAIEKEPDLAKDPNLDPPYDGTQMGLVDDVKSLGRRIAVRWSKELYNVVCGRDNDATAQEILGSLNINEAAVIAAVAAALLAIGAPPPIAAAAAPLIVKKFIWPAKDELCDAWGEAIAAAG
jgi:hypothetical protein